MSSAQCAPLPTMPASKAQQALRAFVATPKSVAAKYGVTVSVTRDSSAADVRCAYRRVLLKAHPDKGGEKEDVQRLQAAKEAWDSAPKKPTPGRPKRTPGPGPTPRAAGPGALVVAGTVTAGPQKDLFRI